MASEPPKTDPAAVTASTATTTAPAPAPAPAATATATAATTTAATAAADTSITEEAPGELTAVVDELLDSLSTKFASVSSEIFEKIEAMSKRLDAMEASLQQSSAPTPK